MEKYSVLISVYNKEKAVFLDAAMQSIFEQTIQPNEVVLVRDGPLTDLLDAVILKYCVMYPNILKVVALPQNVGLGDALNRGLQECSYELVARMDSDDICKYERFAKQLDVFDKYPDLSVVGSWVDEFIDIPKNIVSQRKLPETNEELIVFSRSRNPLNHPSVMFKKRDIQEAGGYQPFYLFEDYYLWARLIIHGGKLYNIQESLLYFRRNPQMIARRGGWKYAKSEYRLMKNFYQIGMFGYATFIKNLFIRFPVRFMPIQLRTLLYNKVLR